MTALLDPSQYEEGGQTNTPLNSRLASMVDPRSPFRIIIIGCLECTIHPHCKPYQRGFSLHEKYKHNPGMGSPSSLASGDDYINGGK